MMNKREELLRIVEGIKELFPTWEVVQYYEGRSFTEWLQDAEKGETWMFWPIVRNKRDQIAIYLDDTFFAVEKVLDANYFPFTVAELKYLDMHGINLTKSQQRRTKQHVEDWIYAD